MNECSCGVMCAKCHARTGKDNWAEVETLTREQQIRALAVKAAAIYLSGENLPKITSQVLKIASEFSDYIEDGSRG